MTAASSEDTRKQLNQIYHPLDEQTQKLAAALKNRLGMKFTRGFYNGHYHRDAAGKYRKDAYPIPVISVMGLCDIEIDFDGVTVTSKLSREQLTETNWSVFADVPFEVYGVKEYLWDFGTHRDIEEMQRRALSSPESEFFISFSLPPQAQADQVIWCAESICQNRFYY